MHATTHHRDGSVTIWNVYTQTWMRATRIADLSDEVWESLGDERSRIACHLAGVGAKWGTVYTVGYRPIDTDRPNPAAHGAVCHVRARRDGNRILCRQENSNGRHREIGRAREIQIGELRNWFR